MVDVLKRWAGGLDWEVTPVSHDGGVDFIGTHEPIRLSLFEDVTIDWRIFGQVKRMATTRRDDIDLAFTKMKRVVQETFLAGRQVVGVMFVISSETERETVQRLVEETWDVYKGPRWYDSAERFLGCFSAERNRIEEITANCFTSEERDVVRQYLSNVTPKFDPSVKGELLDPAQQGQTGKPILRRIGLRSTAPVPVMRFRLRYQKAKGERNLVEVTRPSTLVTAKGFEIILDGAENRHFDLWLRSFVPGRRRLGTLEILDKDGRPCGKVDLGAIHLLSFMEPRYYAGPNEPEEREAKRYIDSAQSGHLETVAVLGSGGSGKSRFCEHLVDRAVNEGFTWIASGQTNSATNGRELVRSVFNWLTTRTSDGPASNGDVIDVLGRIVAGRSDIGESVRQYLDGDAPVDEDHIATALLLLVTERTRNAPTIIHLYDLHWMGSEGFAILRRLIEYLRRNDLKMRHGVLILLEGRDRESIYEPGAMAYRVPEDWFYFLNVTGLPRITMRPWSTPDCKKFIRDFITRPMDVQRPIKLASLPQQKELIEYVEQHATGNPMHLVEQLKRLHDRGIIRQYDNGLFYVRRGLPHNFRTPEKVEDLIRARIHHFKRTRPVAPELLAVLARVGRRVPAELFAFLAREAEIDAEGRATLTQMDVAHIPQSSGNVFEFRHENYFKVFREEHVDDRSPIAHAAIRWYEQQGSLSTQQKAEMVRLLDTAGRTDGGTTIELISSGMKESRAAEDDLLLEEFTRRYLTLSGVSQQKAGADAVDVRYELAKVMTRIGSWDEAATELESMIAALPLGREPLRTYQWVRAKAELSNVYLSQQDCDAAVDAANEGLRLIAAVSPNFKPDRLEEKLLHRIAVALWFDGRAREAVRWQWASYKITGRRKDPWARTTILREMGTLLYHRNPVLGTRVLQRAHDLAQSLPHFSKEPMLIIEIQMVMGKLLAAGQQRAKKETIKHIREEAMEVYSRCQKQNTKYEATLSALVCGAASALLGDLSKAHQWFRDAAALSTQSALGDEIWKARLNLAQVALEMGERHEAKLHAGEALEGILSGLTKGDPANRAARRALMGIPLAHVARIAGPNVLQQPIRAGIVDAAAVRHSPWETRPLSWGRGPQQVLHVRRGDYDYFLMN